MLLIRRNVSFIGGRLYRKPPWPSAAARMTTGAYGMNTVPGGKFQGMSFEEVADNHQQYCQWLVNNADGEKMGRYREFVSYLQERGFQVDDRSASAAPPSVSSFQPVDTQNSTAASGVYEITNAAYDETKVIKSGKMQGKTFEQVEVDHPNFCRWILANYEDPQKNLQRNYKEFYEWLQQREGNANPSPVSSYPESNSVSSYPESSSDQGFAAQPGGVTAWSPPTGGVASAQEGGDEIVCFGKYRGSTFQQVLTEDPRYCRWLLSQNEMFVGKDGQNAQNFQDFVAFLRSTDLPAESGREWKAPQRSAGDARPPNTTISSGVWLVTFGKHSGKTYQEVFNSDRQYCEWFVDRTLNQEQAKYTVDQLSFALYIQLQMRTPQW